MCTAIIPVATENYFFAIPAEHWECIKTFIAAYLLQSFSVDIGNIHVEGKTSFVFMIAAKNYMLPVR